MDVDLQDLPKLLLEMYKRIKSNNCDFIAARRITRTNEPMIRSGFARNFYFLFNRISRTKICEEVRDYRLMTREMVQCILSLKEYNRF